MIVTEVELIALARRGTIEDASELRVAEDRRHSEVLKMIEAGHMAANESLIQAIDAAYERGVLKSQIYRRIGMSKTTIDNMRARLEKWRDKQGGTA